MVLVSTTSTSVSLSDTVLEFSRTLHHIMDGCIASNAEFKMIGVNREAAQSSFFKEMSGGLQSELTTFSADHQ